MEYLPPELLTKIFSFLDPVSVINCRQVCRRWRILTLKIANPLYLPQIMSIIMQELYLLGKLDDILSLRQTCKLWKDGLDKLTLHENLQLIGLTTIDSVGNGVDTLPHLWNPFPSRIVRLKLCYGHDDPNNADQSLENVEGDLLIERFGTHVHFLQIQLQHADCAERHLVKILNNLLQSLKGLVLTECVSPHRFAKSKLEDVGALGNSSLNFDNYELGKLEQLKYLKLDDSDSKLKYSTLYMRIIENAPNLQHLEINGYFPLDMGIVRLLAHRTSSKMTLTHLKLDAEGSCTQEILEILTKSDFPLKYLSLKINGFGDATECSVSTYLLHSSLEQFGVTLERLELKLHWFAKEENMQPDLLNYFPSSKKLSKLERFKLVGYHGQLDFLRDLVMLKALMLVNYNSQSQNVFNSEQSFYDLLKLKELHLILQGTNQADTKLRKFMYENENFAQKYCGLYQEIFP